MRNLIQDGTIVPLVAPADIEPGGIVNVGQIVGIAVGAAKSGEIVQTRLEGVFDGLGVSAAPGAAIYFDATAGSATTTKTGNVAMGLSLGDGRVRLTPQV